MDLCFFQKINVVRMLLKGGVPIWLRAKNIVKRKLPFKIGLHNGLVLRLSAPITEGNMSAHFGQVPLNLMAAL